ncbi:MAG TPA: O-antigen polymerase, partial [bacterium]|nr:O-antigen polymerase [bacterium]
AGSLGLSILYFRDLLSSVGAIPLVELLKLHGRGFDQLRIHSLVALNSPLRYAYAVLIEVVYPSLVAIAFGSWLHTRTIAWLVLLVLTACGGAVSAGASGARSGIAVILVVALATLYLYRKGRVGRNFVLWSLGVVLVFPVAITVALYHTDVLYALRLIGVRLFYTPAYIQYLYFQLVPGHIGYLHGRTSPIFAWLTGQGYFDLPRYVVRIPWPGAPVDATASGPFIGDFYVNFGVPGVMLGGVLAGVVMQLLQIWLVRHRKTITSLAVYAFLLYVFSTLSYRPLQVILWSGGVFFVLLIWGILAMLEATLGTRGAPAPHPEA